MTQNYPSTTNYPGSDNFPGGSDDSASKTDVAKDQAASVGHKATDAGQQVAATAKDQAQNVAAEAGSQAKDLLTQTRGELTEQAGAQQQRLAAGLHSLGDELHSMAHHSDSPGVATDLAKQAASRSHDAASWLESREPGNLVEEAKSFARQRPGAFLAIALGAGLLAGRLTRGVKDATSNDTSTPAATGAHSDAVQQPAAAVTGARHSTLSTPAGVEIPEGLLPPTDDPTVALEYSPLGDERR